MDRVAHPLGGGVSRGRRTPGVVPLGAVPETLGQLWL